MASKESVYEEEQSILIHSGHGKEIFYRIFLGKVNWTRKPGGKKDAVIVFMQYGSNQEWKAARKAKEIAFKMPTHILIEDVENVTEGINKLINTNKRGLK